ncbi:MAG: 2-oxoacid:acceptor oxidoreductase family protein [Armatimonadetes bacterium]|nr:2-oxoacid:acceptor oxidoreductase family protein [Armatimonadota bacterium]
MNRCCEVRLAGAGGQGMGLAGVILAEAAMREGRNVVHAQSYGPESRGGGSVSDVIISEDAIDYPRVRTPHVLLALTQQACDGHWRAIRPGGLLVADLGRVRDLPCGDFRCVVLPMVATARDVVKEVLTANMVALGVIIAVSPVVGRDALEQAVAAGSPRGTAAVNLAAIGAGIELARAGA